MAPLVGCCVSNIDVLTPTTPAKYLLTPLTFQIIRSVHRYIESAKVEATILERVLKADVQGVSGCIIQLEHFEFVRHGKRHYAIVFEELGKSLFQIIKQNNYRGKDVLTYLLGFSIKLVQSFARQLFECLRFLHAQHLTHTDLKARPPAG